MEISLLHKKAWEIIIERKEIFNGIRWGQLKGHMMEDVKQTSERFRSYLRHYI